MRRIFLYFQPSEQSDSHTVYELMCRALFLEMTSNFLLIASKLQYAMALFNTARIPIEQFVFSFAKQIDILEPLLYSSAFSCKRAV